ncbi:MAG: class I SAM-dependent rRNA methyltransferase [Treponema sp.]|nr:class I SAM-dependent rRNA methyltransferase [Treponema sp.]
MKRIILKQGEEDRVLLGHPWVYDNEVDRILDTARPSQLKPGELADVESSRKTYLGRAIANPQSKIIARIYSPSKEGMDKGFFKRRIRESLERRFSCGRFRQGFDLYRESARIVFGEADFLPGLIVDRFTGWPLEAAEAACTERPLLPELVEAKLGRPASWLSVQFLAYGMDQRREDILDALEDTLEWFRPGLAGDSREKPGLGRPLGIAERSTVRARELEGLPLREGIIRGGVPQDGILIFENGFPFAVNLEKGQKTGHFLDQRENHLLAASYAGGARVLDAFSCTGGFGIHAARYGAAGAVCADSSAPALKSALLNARLNRVEDRLTILEADIFELLRSYERRREEFDLIILDPPAFAKSHVNLTEALRGYHEINLRAIRLLSKGGVLVSCSCSQALDEGRFTRMIAEAAMDAGRRLVQMDFRRQAADHPVLLGYDESLYLKCGVYQAL